MSVSIPSSVESIGGGVFAKCFKLNQIKIVPFKEKNINYLENNFLVSKTDLSSDIYDNLLWVNPNNQTIEIPTYIKIIGTSAFDGCSSLTSVSIPSSVTSIESWAFYECSSLTSVSIPSSVTFIGSSAFSECSSLTSVSILLSLNIRKAGFDKKVKITRIKLL